VIKNLIGFRTCAAIHTLVTMVGGSSGRPFDGFLLCPPTFTLPPLIEQLSVIVSLAIHSAAAYTVLMNFEWDEQKNEANIRKHGFSFTDAWEVFEAPMLIDLDDRFDYGENRWIGIGRLRSQIVVIVYTEPDEEMIRVISLRKALSYERQAYEQVFGN
jgi:uncharacterized DUF497 family protein